MTIRFEPQRRRVLAGAAALTLSAVLPRAVTAAQIGEDGLFKQPFFRESFLDFPEDLKGALSADKTFAVLWELKGCPYCKLLHSEVFSQSTIRDYVIAHFSILQLNLIGARPVVDFNGKTYSEKAMALRHEVSSTPTLQFFMPSEVDVGREIGRTGYLKAPEFHQMLRFVHEKGYLEAPFDEWAARNPPPQ